MTERIDWFRILDDLHRAGVDNAEAARRIGVPYSTLMAWKNGICDPNFYNGTALLALHSALVGPKDEFSQLEGGTTRA